MVLTPTMKSCAGKVKAAVIAGRRGLAVRGLTGGAGRGARTAPEPRIWRGAGALSGMQRGADDIPLLRLISLVHTLSCPPAPFVRHPRRHDRPLPLPPFLRPCNVVRDTHSGRGHPA